MKRLNTKGNVLLFVVVAMTAISVLGTGIYFMTTTATFSGLDANDQNRAYQLAVAGRDYALVKNLTATAGRDFTITSVDKFRLVISGDNITSTGIIKENTPYEARRTITVTKTGFSSQADVSFTKDIADFSKTIPQLQTQSSLVIVNPLGQVEMGQGKAYSFGGISYGGSAIQGSCNNGICDFNGGFRAYFKFKLMKAPSATGDPHGFVFTFFNGNNNISTAIGGELGVVSVSDMPELLGYAGDSCFARDASGNCGTNYLDATGKGIQPPKIAVEFDSRYQSCVSGACNQESRCDGTRNHIAYVFWGDLNTTLCKNEASPTYDDNRHGNGTVGSATEPRNSVASDSADAKDYFTGYDQLPRWTQPWLFGTAATAPTFAVRVEVSRSSTNNNYFYRIRTWIKKCLVCDSNGTNCSPCDISLANCCAALTDFDNVKVAFNDMHSADLPNLDRTIELTQPNHDLFSKLAFGWRFASGGSSPENVTISNFNMYFVK